MRSWCCMTFALSAEPWTACTLFFLFFISKFSHRHDLSSTVADAKPPRSSYFIKAKLSPDGSLLASGATNDAVCLWQVDCPGLPVARLTVSLSSFLPHILRWLRLRIVAEGRSSF